MKKTYFRIILAFIFTVSSGCIHTNSRITKEVQLSRSNEDVAHVAKISDLKVRSFIYSKNRWPLSNFISKLKTGEVKAAIQDVDLSYKSSNTDNEILKELIAEGFLPVHIQISNEGTKPQEISASQFSIANEFGTTPPLKWDEVPRSLEKFDSVALLANVYNAV